ncbi:MAG: hypothetical protein KatS3mg015_2541 [Fimbriimonadales bacterium]|nr:MAG: hypothetical protein KatS3mg015_2541 [Fimbriimonadales bacterium]
MRQAVVEIPLISIIIPTLYSRSHWLEKCLAAYHKSVSIPYEIIILHEYGSCGKAWNVGIKESLGDLIHLSADDLEPHPGWLEAATAVLDDGYLPCPRILNSDGTLQSCGDTAEEVPSGTPAKVARVPLLPRTLALKMLPIFENQYMGDYWISWKASTFGWQTVVVREMTFTHHLAPEGRISSLEKDYLDYMESIR